MTHLRNHCGPQLNMNNALTGSDGCSHRSTRRWLLPCGCLGGVMRWWTDLCQVIERTSFSKKPCGTIYHDWLPTRMGPVARCHCWRWPTLRSGWPSHDLWPVPRCSPLIALTKYSHVTVSINGGAQLELHSPDEIIQFHNKMVNR